MTKATLWAERGGKHAGPRGLPMASVGLRTVETDVEQLATEVQETASPV